ncbi:hypothetical protein NKH77_03265 [Streptomyces sp. M19]
MYAVRVNGPRTLRRSAPRAVAAVAAVAAALLLTLGGCRSDSSGTEGRSPSRAGRAVTTRSSRSRSTTWRRRAADRRRLGRHRLRRAGGGRPEPPPRRLLLHLPSRVGPVRSARETDLDLLGQFGRPALAYSGCSPSSSPRSTPPAVPAAAGQGVRRVRPRHRPSRPAQPVRPARGGCATPAREPRAGHRLHLRAAPSGGRSETARTVRFPSATVGFTWSAGSGRWLVSMDGSPARTTDGGRLGRPRSWSST